MVVALLCVKEKKILTVRLLTSHFCCFCVGTHSGHNTDFQMMFHGAGLVGTQNTLH